MPRRMEKKTPSGGVLAGGPGGLVGYVGAPARTGETFSLVSRTGKGEGCYLEACERH